MFATHTEFVSGVVTVHIYIYFNSSKHATLHLYSTNNTYFLIDRAHLNRTIYSKYKTKIISPLFSFKIKDINFGILCHEWLNIVYRILFYKLQNVL